ncbi:MAG: DUF2238 domain-containing protein, partial [Candidatus Aureabacteria bacterium]|nr:DUF2238 domain-containing protein [Candidatus Auribacterota bacterium]
SVWWAENIPIIMLVAAILFAYRFYRFSTLSCVLMSFLVIFHTIGGYYTFSRVPFDFVNNLLGGARNNYDRISHFTVGFYAYPIAEVLFSRKLTHNKFILILFPIFAIFAVASIYEIFEWLYAVCADNSAGIAVLGSQGDIWDAQKDMLSDAMGAVFAMGIFYFVHRRESIFYGEKS